MTQRHAAPPDAGLEAGLDRVAAQAVGDTLDEVMPEHFAYFHTFSQLGGLREAQRVFGTPDNLQILLDSLNSSLFDHTDSAPDDATQPRPAAH